MNAPEDRDALRWVRNIAVLWLVFLGAFAFGAITVVLETWPYGLFRSSIEFLEGDDGEATTLKEKIENDFGIKPARHIVDSARQVSVPDHYRVLEGLDLKGRRLDPLVHFTEEAPRGYRLVYGTFDFEDGLHGAVLLDPDGQLANRWVVSQEGTAWAERQDDNVYPHGVEILPDGSLIAAFDGGSSAVRYGYCGEEIWRTQGTFHHSLSLGDDGTVWAWGNPFGQTTQTEYMVELSVDDGTVQRHILLDHVWPENPGIDPFAIRQDDKAQASLWMFDRFHVNDVEPLPARWADAYPGFEAGDLLISLRSVNLVAVVDPDDLAVKWWRQGLTRRQHDPDWNERGTITIFDNNMHRDYSRIQEIDPVSYASRVVVPGEPYSFYTWHRGKHDAVPGGGYLVATTEQGRLFEVNADGEVVFDFINRYGEEGGFLAVSEGRFLPVDFFEELPQCEG